QYCSVYLPRYASYTVLPLASCFFFYSSGHHRDLDSFPTRRSSDLVARGVRSGARDVQAGGQPHRSAPGRVAQGHGWARVCLRGQDRKSTRLNSSHVSISYAVFCLKKKKKSERDDYEKRKKRNRSVA